MSEPAPQKAFAAAEANGLIATMEAVMEEVAGLCDVMASHDEQLRSWGPSGDPTCSAPNTSITWSLCANRCPSTGARSASRPCSGVRFIARGIRVPPGGLEHGLLDFPATLNGRWVYLCRKRGKPRVEPWHEITAGFAGRQPVTEDDEPRMGMERTDPWDAAP